MAWDIVFWAGKSTADYIPTNWGNANKTSYKFPSGPKMTEQRKRRLILTCQDLNVGEFNWVPATCKWENITILNKARKLTETSNLETDESQENKDPKNNKKKKTNNYQSNLKDEFDENLQGVRSLTSRVLDNMYRLCEKLKFQMDSLEKKVDLILNYFNKQPPHNVASSNNSIKQEILALIPIQSLNNFIIFNEILEKDEYKNSFINILYMIGGENLRKCIRLQLRQTLTDDVALKFSGLGKKGKLSFCTTNIYNAILEATQKRFSTSTIVEIRQYISTYLAASKDRIIRSSK
ncbi:hypothetical protein FQR65_LT09995 [Abscondita terminalis]|nr:hypothetical protein FQR65_LT09995 [Abscondita terminalis]